MQHYRKCHPSQIDITGNITFRTTDKYSRNYMYTSFRVGSNEQKHQQGKRKIQTPAGIEKHYRQRKK